MIEETVLDYLKSAGLSAPVYIEIPKNPSQEYFAIERTSGGMENHIKNSTFAIKSYANSLYRAACMNEEIKTAMLDGLITLGSISKVSLNSDYNFTDTTTKKYRYQAVFDIYHY